MKRFCGETSRWIAGVRDDAGPEVGERAHQVVVAPLDHHVDEVVERLAHEVLEGEVVGAADVPEVVDAADVGVADLRGDVRLVEEHVDEGLGLGEVRVDRLDRDEALEALREAHAPEVDRGHAAGAELLAQREAAELVREADREALGLLHDRELRGFPHQSRYRTADPPPGARESRDTAASRRLCTVGG